MGFRDCIAVLSIVVIGIHIEATKGFGQQIAFTLDTGQQSRVLDLGIRAQFTVAGS